MPFVRESHYIHTPIKASLFLIRTLGFSQKLAQKTIDKARLRNSDNTPIHKSQIISGRVWLTRFVSDYYTQDELLEPIFTTSDFALFDKPPKLLTHPKGTFTHKSLVDSIRAYKTDAQPIHRLDYETSGAVLVAHSQASERQLKGLLESKGIHKLYLAKIQGILDREIFVDAPIHTPHKTLSHAHRGNLSIRSIITPLGKSASTILRPITTDLQRRHTYIHAIPLTGRTHQIRLHCAHIGHPICGDLLYGADDTTADLYLRALRYAPTRNDSHIYQTTQAYANLLAHTLHLHALSLHFCFNGISYALYTPPPRWWLA